MEELAIEVFDEMLSIDTKFDYDESIQSLQVYEYTPQTQANNNTHGQSISITINAQDIYTLPSKSYITIRGQIRRGDNDHPFAADDEITLINNAMMYLFSCVKYELGGITIETINNPGQVTSILAYLSQPDDFNTSSGLKYCWSKDTTNHASSVKYTKTAANVTGDNPNYNQGFAARKAFLFSSDPRGRFTFNIPL
mgnify:FL=1